NSETQCHVIAIVIRLTFSFFFSSRRRHTRCYRDWSSDVCSSDLSPSSSTSAGGVVPADVLDDGELELRSGPPDAVGDQLGLEARSEERRGRQEWTNR